ncbi:MAG: hypothetical protein WC341_00590 [Bacteroidales bacterium]|jgi:hypothetical protein
MDTTFDEPLKTPEELLDRLVELEKYEQQLFDTLNTEKQKMIDSVLTPEIRAKIQEIEEEFLPKYASIQSDPLTEERYSEMESIKKAVTAMTIQAGESLKGKLKMAVLQKAKIEEVIIVDTGMLVGMTVNIPKLQACWHKETHTSSAKVTFRNIEDKTKK